MDFLDIITMAKICQKHKTLKGNLTLSLIGGVGVIVTTICKNSSSGLSFNFLSKKFWVVEVPGTIKNAQFWIPLVIGFRSKTSKSNLFLAKFWKAIFFFKNMISEKKTFCTEVTIRETWILHNSEI